MSNRFAHLEFDHEHDREEQSQGHVRPGLVTDLASDFERRARSAQRAGRFEEALRFYTRTLGEQRTRISAWVGQVQMLVELDECREARLWSDKALELFRGNGELLAAKAQACARLLDHKAAQAASDGALQATGDSPWRWQARGEVLLSRRERFFDECFERAVAHSAADWFDRVVVARILMHYGRAAAAVRYLMAAIEREPTSPFAWLVLGDCRARLGLAGPARDCYERCLELEPGHALARSGLQELGRGPSLLARLRALLGGR